MTDEERKLYFDRRYKRMNQLVEMNAPSQIIAREAILIASVLIDSDGRASSLIPFILAEFPDNNPRTS